MKKLLMILIIAHSLAFVCNGEEEIRGLWAATVFRLDFPSAPGLSPVQLESELQDLVSRAKEHGFNALFFQVRPCADAFYPSKYFPWSAWLTGTQGQAPDDQFDPLACLVDTAHKAGIQIHTWVNPFRVTRTSASSKAEALSTLSLEHPARLHPEWVVLHSDGCLYFDPGLPQVRQLVRDGVREIAENYGVDGIHFDDYFYPGRDFADDTSYALYGGNYKDIDTFRTAAVNDLIAGVQADVKAIRNELLFGVSPAGIWANSDTDPRGSDTIGFESKIESYADALAWMEAGSVDYIAPQLYWAIGAREGEFLTLLTWWREQAARTGTDLIIGLAGYRTAETQDPTNVWYGSDELRRQLSMLSGVTEGYILFRAGSLFDSPAVAACFAGTVQTAQDADEYWPLTKRWLSPGGTLEVSCRGSHAPTLALWNGRSVLLSEDSPGNQAGSISDLTPGSSPVIYAHFTGSCLLVNISPGVVDVPEPSECLSFEEHEADGALQLRFTFTVPTEAAVSLSGGQLLLDVPAQRVPLLFESGLLESMDCQPITPGCRYLLTPGFVPRKYSLETAGCTVTIRLE